MNKIAVIDIGSNSIKLVLAIYNKHGFQIIDEIKESVRLGEDMDKNDYMKEARIEKALETLKMFKGLCKKTNTKKIVSVGTAAVREATNQKDFLKRVKKETGLKVKVLSGKKEAFYDYCGVVNSIDKKNGIIIDIGGGSIELTWMKDRKVEKIKSFNFGAVTLSSMFDLKDKIKSSSINKLNEFLKKEFDKLDWLKKENFKTFIGVGGTIRNIARINKRKKDYPFKRMHNYKMDKDEVKEVFELVSNKDYKERRKISGLSKKRADIFVGANSFVYELMNYLDINDLLISGKGIREGILYNEKILNGHIVKDVLDYSISEQMEKISTFKSHMENVYELLNTLVFKLEDLYSFKFSEFNGSVFKIVKTAGLLHDLGSIIDYYNHHEHTFYMILNSNINGINHREQLIAAFIAASHRHKRYKLHKYNLNRKTFTSIIDRKGKDKEMIRKTGILLEIAESLDRNMSGDISIKDINIKSESVEILVTSINNPKLEISDALEVKKGFKSKFKKDLVIKDISN